MFSIVFAYLFHRVSNRSPPAEPIGPLAKQAQPIVMPDPVMKAILIGELDIFCCTLLFAMFASRGDLFFHFRGS